MKLLEECKTPLFFKSESDRQTERGRERETDRQTAQTDRQINR